MLRIPWFLNRVAIPGATDNGFLLHVFHAFQAVVQETDCSFVPLVEDNTACEESDSLCSLARSLLHTLR